MSDEERKRIFGSLYPPTEHAKGCACKTGDFCDCYMPIVNALTGRCEQLANELTAERAAHERTRERVRVLEHDIGEMSQAEYVLRERVRAMHQFVTDLRLAGRITPEEHAAFVSAALAAPEAVPETPAEHFRRCGPFCKHLMICRDCVKCFALCDAHKADPDAGIVWRAAPEAGGGE